MYHKMSVLASLKSLFAAENIPKTIETALVDSVKTAVEQQASDDGKHLVDECRKHWETVRPRVAERLAIQLKDFEEETGGFGPTRERFIKRMGRAARQAVVNLKIRGGLDMQLADRRAGLKTWLFTVCRNRALDVLRKEKRMVELDDEAALRIKSPDTGPGNAADWDERVTQVMSALDRLSENQREVIAHAADLSRQAVANETKLRLPAGRLSISPFRLCSKAAVFQLLKESGKRV